MFRHNFGGRGVEPVTSLNMALSERAVVACREMSGQKPPGQYLLPDINPTWISVRIRINVTLRVMVRIRSGGGGISESRV